MKPPWKTMETNQNHDYSQTCKGSDDFSLQTNTQTLHHNIYITISCVLMHFKAVKLGTPLCIKPCFALLLRPFLDQLHLQGVPKKLPSEFWGFCWVSVFLGQSGLSWLKVAQKGPNSPRWPIVVQKYILPTSLSKFLIGTPWTYFGPTTSTCSWTYE